MIEARVMMGARPIFLKKMVMSFPFAESKFKDILSEALSKDMQRRPDFEKIKVEIGGLKKA